jgi:hypothetical protein
MTSNKSTITLTQGKEVKEIRNGMQIAGGYTATKDQALFYTVTDQKKQLVGSGTILPDDTHHFSRNLALDTTNLKDGAELELKIYTQSNKGAIVDELSITGVFAAQ